MTARRWPFLAALLLLTSLLPARGEYRKPPEAIRKILDVPPPPSASLAPKRDYLLLADYRAYPSIAELSRPFLRLAGLRIDSRSNGPRLPPSCTGFTLVPVDKG